MPGLAAKLAATCLTLDLPDSPRLTSTSRPCRNSGCSFAAPAAQLRQAEQQLAQVPAQRASQALSVYSQPSDPAFALLALAEQRQHEQPEVPVPDSQQQLLLQLQARTALEGFLDRIEALGCPRPAAWLPMPSAVKLIGAGTYGKVCAFGLMVHAPGASCPVTTAHDLAALHAQPGSRGGTKHDHARKAWQHCSSLPRAHVRGRSMPPGAACSAGQAPCPSWQHAVRCRTHAAPPSLPELACRCSWARRTTER